MGAIVTQPRKGENGTINFPTTFGLMSLCLLVDAILYIVSEHTLAAWILITAFYIILLGYVVCLSAKTPVWKRIIIEIWLTIAAGVVPVLFDQIETRFSSEEFFVALQSLVLMLFWVFLRLSYALIASIWNPIRLPNWKVPHHTLIHLLSGLTAAGYIFFSIWSYQRSFFANQVLEFPGIDPESPFLCDESSQSIQTYDGIQVFNDLLAQVEANPQKEPPEFAMLALGTGNPEWAKAFKEALLDEALQGRFTQPAGSVKYNQYLASQRVYYYAKIRDIFPGLFTKDEERKISDWFTAINHQALTPGWVDWLYAFAFSKLPSGPYENQETGAGLLSILEATHLSDTTQTDQNQQYLDQNPRGWATGFRVTDDTAFYQTHWIDNALFQSLYSQDINSQNLRNSFEWLKMLSPPDGSPIHFNHIGSALIADSMYLGAVLLQDPEYVWLAGRAVEHLAKTDRPIDAQPGIDGPSELIGKSPTTGTCLIFGNSGLPNQPGPLAPDKIVFRSGWEPDDLYLLLNLRFTGWHRYKATNNIIQVYQGGPILIENTAGKSFKWLPIGRSLFRDKRIPRENLNGLVIEKRGLSKVLYQLTGLDSPWAQDPPYYADISIFENQSDLDISKTEIQGWHGWDHERTIYFHQDGLVAILDQAQGPQMNPAEILWHFPGTSNVVEGRILGESSTGSAAEYEVFFLPLSDGEVSYQRIHTDESELLQAKIQCSDNGYLRWLTVILGKDWTGANIRQEDNMLVIIKGIETIEIRLDE